MVFMVCILAVVGYDLVYCGLKAGDDWQHPWQPLLQGLGVPTGGAASGVGAAGTGGAGNGNPGTLHHAGGGAIPGTGSVGSPPSTTFG